MSSHLTDYELVEANTPNTLKIKVDAWLSQGYECQGGVAVYQRNYNSNMTGLTSSVTHYAQAMIKRGIFQDQVGMPDPQYNVLYEQQHPSKAA